MNKVYKIQTSSALRAEQIKVSSDIKATTPRWTYYDNKLTSSCKFYNFH